MSGLNNPFGTPGGGPSLGDFNAYKNTSSGSSGGPSKSSGGSSPTNGCSGCIMYLLGITAIMLIGKLLGCS